MESKSSYKFLINLPMWNRPKLLHNSLKQSPERKDKRRSNWIYKILPDQIQFFLKTFFQK